MADSFAPIPNLAPPVWSEHIRASRFAHAIVANTSEYHQDRGLHEEIRKCSVVMIGLPDDLGITLNHGRPGAALGPNAFRQALGSFGVAEPAGWVWPKVFDAGNVIPAPGKDARAMEETHDRVTQAVKALLALSEGRLFPVAIGGGHDLTFAFVRGVIEFWKARGVTIDTGVYFDAHLDVRETPGSGMAFRSLIEKCGVKHLGLHGFNELANSREFVEYFLDKGGVLMDHAGRTPGGSSAAHSGKASGWMPGSSERENGSERGVFVSLDLDCLDASAAPGVSAMNPAGMRVSDVAGLVERAGSDGRVKCFDIMELCPPHDENGRTARAAAALFLTFLKGMSRRQ